ncbi:MAG: Asp-tRNA(Asn)/Glu-tRNA(Gln) amidotransferase GatCAB subunit C [Methanomassiliicoccaceae archaeon]|jgi:aspartyl-tRNA(Asn)/glutamyl-tRNA(Gln) amidotransferase subunit C|nr:Asp-tRNA(Asn)/Glu-tRNA(Gln) amidotransferase GatCAB subunit C [Methanomassiliicoccaceae archaeon]
MDMETIRRVAGFARIELTDDELKGFKEETDKIFELLNTLNDAPACDSFCFDPVGVSDSLREDVPVVNDNIAEMLKSMSTYDGFVRGPKIV